VFKFSKASQLQRVSRAIERAAVNSEDFRGPVRFVQQAFDSAAYACEARHCRQFGLAERPRGAIRQFARI
jgi:hypothetical protein